MIDVISRAENRITIRDNVSYFHLRYICSSLHHAITRAGCKNIILDFSLCAGITEAVMLPLMPIITKYQTIGVDFTLILPTQEDLARLFANANWAHHINPDTYQPSTHEGGHVPALCFGNNDDDNAYQILDRVLDLILRQLETNRDALKAVEWSLCEIMDNVSSHAESEVGGFIQATAYKQGNRVEFVVADAGMGIPNSMGIRDHGDALQRAIDEGVTSKPVQNAGNGLYGSYRVAFLSGGQFEIHSLLGHLFCDGATGQVSSKKEVVLYSGTSVRCSINVDDPDLLGKALQFKGQKHDPPFDYVERKFEDDSGEIVFTLKDEARRDFGSRPGGARIRTMIENLLKSNASILIDFSEIGIVSSSFADEVFGRLFVKLGPRAFMTRIRMRNVDPTIEGLIDRAILQRTKLSDG